MGRDREPVADADDPCLSKHAPVAWREPDHPWHVSPGKAGTGELARAVDRVAVPETIFVEPVLPDGGVIVQPDGALRIVIEIDMLHQREIPDPHLFAALLKGGEQLSFGTCRAGIVDERVSDRQYRHNDPNRPQARP
jgi:hypothetical protein